MIVDTHAGSFAAIALRWTLVLIVVYSAEAIAANAPKHCHFLFMRGHSLPLRWALRHYQFLAPSHSACVKPFAAIAPSHLF